MNGVTVSAPPALFAEFTGDTFYAHTDAEADAQKRDYLRRILRGHLSATGIADPDTGTDALVVGFNGKYTYGFWRPETAIKAVGTLNENPDVTPDPEWTPVLSIPMHPEYPCQHCTSGSAAQTSLEAVFGDGPLRFSYTDKVAATEYTSLRAFAEEQSESRVPHRRGPCHRRLPSRARLAETRSHSRSQR